MKPRKSRDLQKVLLKKGFVLHPEKGHHQFYYLEIEGKKQNVYTYFSHGKKEYDTSLISSVKRQLKFTDSKLAEEFFDCPMSGEEYIVMLKTNGSL